jgi:hypothetical protein
MDREVMNHGGQHSQRCGSGAHQWFLTFDFGTILAQSTVQRKTALRKACIHNTLRRVVFMLAERTGNENGVFLTRLLKTICVASC